MAAALRCHLLIGPPASGKTTIATLLAPLLDAELFSTDRIRDELYGDPMIQGHWHEVEERLHAGIQATVAAGRSVLIDACLLYTSPSPRDRQKSRMPSSA